MISKILLSIVNNLINNNFIIKLRSKKLKKDIKNYDFTNLSFENNLMLKNIFFSKQKIFAKDYNEKNIEYHSFNWLFLARKLGGAEAIKISKNHIFNWQVNNYSFLSFVWNNNVISKRLLNLLYHYDFFAISANNEEKDKLITIIAKNYFVLNLKNNLDKTINQQTIEIQKALLLFNLIFKYDYKKIIKSIKKNIKKNVNTNGVHISMNPCYHAEYINHLYEIKKMILFFKIKLPEEINFQILNMTSSLIKFFHKDNTLGFFNGSNNSNFDTIKKLSEMSKDIKAKDLHNIENGIAVYENNFAKVMFDVAKPSIELINEHLHAGTLGIELSCNNEKIFTNCGSIEKKGIKRLDYLRFSAAHSTIILNNTNICELADKKKSYKRVPENVLFNVIDKNEEIIWNANHDGYKKNFSKIISRKLFISKEGIKIFGEDSIISSKLSKKDIIYDIRFHLTPICKTSLTRGKNSVLIKTSSNNSYIFESSSNLSLNDSIFIGDGRKIEKTSQIVISGLANTFKKTIKWSLTKLQ